jgi:putative ABC transport system permease protein
VPADGEENPTMRFRPVSHRFFAVLGVPIVAGRGFTDADDRADAEPVAIVSQSAARRLFANGDAVNRHMWSAIPKPEPWRIVGVAADVDDENVVQEPSMTVYRPLRQGLPSRLFVRATADPYALVASVTRTIREMSAEQAVDRPATLEDVRAEVLTPERLKTFVFSALGGMALLIAVVGVAGVLAFSVSARTQEFGVRLALGSTPSQLLTGVLKEGAVIVMFGIAAGAVFGYAFAPVASAYLKTTQMPDVVTMAGAAGVLTAAAVIASLIPAARASRVDVLEALRAQ